MLEDLRLTGQVLLPRIYLMRVKGLAPEGSILVLFIWLMTPYSANDDP